MTAEDDRTVFDYFQVGDRVRHHAGLNSYEKYDKSHDSIIFCNACATLCQISDDVCWRCKCPLLKQVFREGKKVVKRIETQIVMMKEASMNICIIKFEGEFL